MTEADGQMSKEVRLQYVLLTDVGQYLFDVWTISDCLAGTHHGAYSVLMTTDREPE